MARHYVETDWPDVEHYLGSQQFQDEALLAFHEEVVRRLRRDPARVLAEARQLLGAWEAGTAFSGAERAYLKRWRELLAGGDVDAVARVLVEISDEGRYLRQCSPFAASLSEDEWRDIRRICEARVRDRARAPRR